MSCSPADEMDAAPFRTILDCDTDNEVDDQFAIAYALGAPASFDVLGVVSVHNTVADGPASRDRYQREAEKVVGLCGRDVPCVPGAAGPMEDTTSPVPSDGLSFMVEAAREGPLLIVCTGPATDVASLVLARPEVRHRLRVVWLGGFGDQRGYEQHNRGGELNGRADIAAWRVLLESPVELLQVPGWSGPHEILVGAGTFGARLRKRQSPVAVYLADILEQYVAADDGSLNPRGRKRLWDLAPVASVADPGAVQVAPLAVPTLDPAGAHDFSRRGREIEVVTGLDTRRVIDGFLEALGRHGC